MEILVEHANDAPFIGLLVLSALLLFASLPLRLSNKEGVSKLSVTFAVAGVLAMVSGMLLLEFDQNKRLETTRTELAKVEKTLGFELKNKDLLREEILEAIKQGKSYSKDTKGPLTVSYLDSTGALKTVDLLILPTVKDRTTALELYVDQPGEPQLLTPEWISESKD